MQRAAQLPAVKRPVADDLRAAAKLLVDATTGVNDVVQDMQRAIAPWPIAELSALTYAGVRTVAKVVGFGVDQALAQLAPVLGENTPGPERLAALAALNGVIGDRLVETGNALAQPMEVRRASSSTRRLLVLVHGSSMNDLQWLRHGHDHGQAVRGVDPAYVRYNSGLHVSVNGRALSAAIDRLTGVDEVLLLGFSMGGLVARSACHVAELEGHGWRSKLTTLITLGTPHHGSALERGGSWADTLLGLTPWTRPLARLGKIRSAGVTDLRFGYVLDAHWQGRDRFALGGDDRTPLPLPRGVRCFAIAGTQSAGPGPRLRSDGLVPVESALGQHPTAPPLTLAFPAEHQRIVYGAAHLDLLHRREAFEAISGWLRA